MKGKLMKRKLLGGLFLALTSLDQGIKQYVEEAFRPDEVRSGERPFLVRKVYNRGFAMNALENRPELVKGASVAALSAVAAADAYTFQKKGRFLSKLGLIFISAGSISNVYDRLIRGKVIDYLSLNSKWRAISRVTVNLADAYLLIGTCIISIGELLRK